MLFVPHSVLVDFVVWEVVHVAGLNTTSTPSVGGPGHAQREGGRAQQEQAQHAHPDQPHADSSIAVAAAAPDQPAAARDDDDDDDGGHDGGTATGAHAVAAGRGETPQVS